MPTDNALHLIVNIPSYRLDVWSHDTLLRVIPVAVGMRAYQSPRGEFEITSVEWNPWWIPPDRPWAAGQKRMPPGPANPMGRVKLNFRPLYFLHGSPLERSIGTAASHGCVRLRNTDAIGLATIVIHAGSPGLTDDDLRAMAASASTRFVDLDQPVSLSMRYDLAVVRGDSLFVFPDVYGLATRPLRDIVLALLEQGNGLGVADVALVDSFTTRIPASGRGIAIEKLLDVRRPATRRY